MRLRTLAAPSCLAVDPDSSIVDLAYLLGLYVNIDFGDDHFHIHTDTEHKFLVLTSYMSPTVSDVKVSKEVFSEILIDIASGMQVKTAFEKQGYTF